MTKECTVCKRELPNTIEYFRKINSYKGKYKLNNKCKECTGGNFKIKTK